MTKTIDIVELRYKRCSLRYGVGDCQASGSIKCFQTYKTCDYRAAYNLDGEVRWFFHKAGDAVPSTASLPSANEWHGPSLPLLQSVDTEESRINPGANREGESPFGLRGTIKVTLADALFSNQFGDFYATERSVKGSIGALLLAWLGEAVSQVQLYWYRGFAGQALADMDQRRFDVTNMDPPSNGGWVIEGMDPLHRALRKKAKFPRATDLRLIGDIDASTTDVALFGLEVDVSDQFGNTSTSYARIGREIISYTGYSGADGVWSLNGVSRGALGTVASDHSDNDAAQRVGHFERRRYFDIVRHILRHHTTIDNSLIPYASQWKPEGLDYMSTLYGTGTIAEPMDVDKVCGMAMRDGMFSLWWDSLDQLIKIKAMRQPLEPPLTLDEDRHIVEAKIIRRPDDRITRVALHYGRQDPTERLEDVTNYRSIRVRIDAEAESDEFADGTSRALTVYSPFVRTDANAVIYQSDQLLRYKDTPQYVSFRVSRKDAHLSIGDVVKIETKDLIEKDGSLRVAAWEIIQGPKEIERGLVYEYMAQSFVLFERPAFIMANDAPDFENATDEEKEKGYWLSDNDGLMPDGSPPYVIQ